MGQSQQGRIYLHAICSRALSILLTFPAPRRIDASTFELAKRQGLRNHFCVLGMREGLRLLWEVSNEWSVLQAGHLNED